MEAPPKPRSSLSSMAEAEPELLGRARRRLFGRGQGGVRGAIIAYPAELARWDAGLVPCGLSQLGVG